MDMKPAIIAALETFARQRPGMEPGNYGNWSAYRVEGERVRIDYCTGQYFPTEYRRAVCRVLASALWAHTRDTISGEVLAGRSPGDRIRKYFRTWFGRTIASRYFN